MNVDFTNEFQKINCNSIAEHLIKLRHIKNISQEDLAKALQTTKSNISKYECGLLYPTKELSVKLANFFGLNTKYFFDDYLAAMDTFHKDLNTLLNNINLSKLKLCSSIGISKRTLYRYINNKEFPSRNTFVKIRKFISTEK